MQVNDMVLQMALMSALQQMQASAVPGQTTDASSQKTNFKDLLEQRRHDLTTGSDRQDVETSQPDRNETAEQPQNGKEPAATDAELTALAAGQMLMANCFVPMEQFAAVQPEGLAETAPVEMLTAEGGTLQADAAQLLGVSTQSDAQPVQAVFTETVSGGEAQTTLPQQAAEAVAPAGDQANTAQDLAQQLTQSDPRQEKNQPTEDAAVQSWHTPLFRDVEATPVRVGDAPVDMTAPAQDVENTLGSALKGAVEQGDQFLEIRLSPANLGNVVAEFTRSPEGALHVVLRAETEQAAKLLSSHASALSLMLQDSSHSEVRVEVPQPQQEQTPWQQPDQNGGQQQQQQQQQQRQQNAPRRETESFLHQLRLGLVQMETQAV